MSGGQISNEGPDDNTQQQLSQPYMFQDPTLPYAREFARESPPCFKELFQPYDPKKHHVDAKYISEAFQGYHSGKEQIALEVPLNLPTITDRDVKSRDLYHPVISRNVLSPRGFTLHCNRSKRPELPLMPPDKLLAHASERHLNSVALNPFLAKQLSPHQSVGQFICLSDGTLCTYPLTSKTISSKHKRTSTFSQPSTIAHVSARNLTSPLGSFAEPSIQGTLTHLNLAHRKCGYKGISSAPTYSKQTQEIHMKLFPVVDNRTSTPGKQCRSESVPIITPMVTSENLVAWSVQSSPKQSKTSRSNSKFSMSPVRKRPSSTYIADSFPGRLLGERRPLTTTYTRQCSPPFKSQDKFLTREPAAKDFKYLENKPQHPTPTAVKRPVVRSSLGAWALDQSPAEEILEKVNRAHALPPRHINFSCKKAVPLYRARSTE